MLKPLSVHRAAFKAAPAAQPCVHVLHEPLAQRPEVRRAATRRIKEMIDLVARQSPDWGQPAAHERALVTVATMVGTLVLARAVDDAVLSDALCSAALKRLAPTGA